MAGLQREEPFDPVCIPTITGNCGAERNVKGCSQFVAFSCLIDEREGILILLCSLELTPLQTNTRKRVKKIFKEQPS